MSVAVCTQSNFFILGFKNRFKYSYIVNWGQLRVLNDVSYGAQLPCNKLQLGRLHKKTKVHVFVRPINEIASFWEFSVLFLFYATMTDQKHAIIKN